MWQLYQSDNEVLHQETLKGAAVMALASESSCSGQQGRLQCSV